MKTAVVPDGYEYLFTHMIKPRMSVKLGETFICETEDAFAGHMYKEGALPTPEYVPEMERTPADEIPKPVPFTSKV